MIAIYANPNRDIGGAHTEYITSRLKKFELEYFLLENSAVGTCEVGVAHRFKDVARANIVIAVGGDGTLIDIAKICAMYDVPVLGINTGNLGFLSEISQSEIDLALEKISKNSYESQERNIIEATFEGRKFYALNEVILSRTLKSILCKAQVFVDGNLATESNGDGIIVSTPTGSTAYSLSCGGPILAPNLDAMIIIAICPHSLLSRPIVVGGDSKVILKPVNRSDLELVVDGKIVSGYEKNSEVVVKKSEKTVKFIKITNENFYDKLLAKMVNWAKN